VLYHNKGKLFAMLAPQGSSDENAALLPKEERTSMAFATSLIHVVYSNQLAKPEYPPKALPL
jgi:hypothetical protein